MHQLGQTAIQITPIIMGTWQAGKKGWVGIDDSDSIATLQAAFASGITTFDTAAVYGGGHAEKIVGQALHQVRNQVVIATKVFANDLNYNRLINSCNRSLENLQTDYIDLLQIHWPAGSFDTKEVPIEESMRALMKLKKQQKIRAIGVSNFSLQQLIEARQYGEIDSIQSPYSLFWRHIEKDIMPYCVQHNISILAYSSLAQGLLTGKFGSDHVFAEADNRSRNKLFHGKLFQYAQQALDKLRPIAERKKISLSELALAWTIAQPQTCAIAGARQPQQALENSQAMHVVLSEQELQTISDIGDSVYSHVDDDPLLWDSAITRKKV